MAQSLLLKTLKSLLLELRSVPSAGRLTHPKAAAHPSHKVWPVLPASRANYRGFGHRARTQSCPRARRAHRVIRPTCITSVGDWRGWRRCSVCRSVWSSRQHHPSCTGTQIRRADLTVNLGGRLETLLVETEWPSGVSSCAAALGRSTRRLATVPLREQHRPGAL